VHHVNGHETFLYVCVCIFILSIFNVIIVFVLHSTGDRWCGFQFVRW